MRGKCSLWKKRLMALIGWFESLVFFVSVFVALALWPIDDTALLLFYFLLRQFDLGRDVHGDVFCACEALAVTFCLLIIAFLANGHGIYGLS